jgi:hypothetical protein
MIKKVLKEIGGRRGAGRHTTLFERRKRKKFLGNYKIKNWAAGNFGI